MTLLKEAKRLFGEVDENRSKKLEKLILELREEFDTLHRICRILVDDLEIIETKLTEYATAHTTVQRAQKELCAKVDLVGEIADSIKIHEARMRHIETSILSNIQHSPIINVHSNGGTSVGGNVERDLTVNTGKKYD